MELNQPSENLGIYNPSASYSGPNSWFAQAVDPQSTNGSTSAPVPPVYVVADNIIALVVRPKVGNPTQSGPAVTETAPYYAYDTKAYTNNPSDPFAKLAKNQLPPLIQVTLVAIDEDSGNRLASKYGSVHPPLLEDAAQLAGGEIFADVTKYDNDITALEKTLQSYRLNYRIFVTDVSVPGAKWSQTN